MFESNNLVLRKTTKDDIDLYRDMFICPIITRYLPNMQPYTEAQIEEYLNNRITHWNNYPFGTFTIHEKETNEKIGYVGVEVLSNPAKSDIRFGIIRSKNSRGYANEAGLTCLKYTFDLGYNDRIYGAAVKENTASIKTLLKLGMKPAPNLRLYDTDDLDYFAIHRDEI